MSTRGRARGRGLGRARWLVLCALACALACARGVASTRARADAVVDAVGDVVGDAAGTTPNGAVGVRPRARFQRNAQLGGWRKRAKKARKAAKKAAKKAAEAAKKKAEEAAKKAAEKAAEAKRKAEELARSKVASMKRELSTIEKYLSVFSTAKGKAEQVVDDVDDLIKQVGKSSDLSEKIDELTSKVTGFPDEIAKKVSGFVDDVVGSIFGGVEGLADEVGEMFSTSGAAALGVPTKDHEDHVTRMLSPEHLEKLLRKHLRDEEYDAGAHTRAPILGGSPFDGCLSIPIENVLPADLLGVGYGMRWPKHLSNSSFAPDSLRAGFPDPKWETCLRTTGIKISDDLGPALFNVFKGFFIPLFDAVTDGAKAAAVDSKKNIMKKMGTITDELDRADQAAKTIKNILDNVKSTFQGRRRLLTQQDMTRDMLSTVRVASHARADHIKSLHANALDDIESYVLLEMAKIRSTLIEDPFLESDVTMQRFPLYAARMNQARLGGAFNKAASNARSAFAEAMQAMAETEMGLELVSELKVALEMEAKVETFKTGDLFDLVSGGYIPNPVQFDVTFPLPLFPAFQIKIRLDASFAMPYFMLAEMEGKMVFTVTASSNAGIKLKDRKLSTEYKPPSLKFEPQIDTKIEAHAQIGFNVEFEEQYLALCFGSFVCAGPQSVITQNIYAGSDAYAAYSNQGTYDSCLLQAKFAESFEYSDDYKKNRCGKAGGLSYGFGAYFQVPKTQIESKLLIELSESCPNLLPSPVIATFPDENDPNPNFFLAEF